MRSDAPLVAQGHVAAIALLQYFDVNRDRPRAIRFQCRQYRAGLAGSAAAVEWHHETSCELLTRLFNVVDRICDHAGAAIAIACDPRIDHHRDVFFQPVPMHLEHRRRQHDFIDGRTVVYGEEAHAAILAVDHTHRVDNASKALLVVARRDVIQPHGGYWLQMAAISLVGVPAEVQAQRGLLVGERLQQLPRPGIDQRHFMHTGLVAEQAVLRRIGLRALGLRQRCRHGSECAGAVRMQLVERTGLDQRFNGATVDRLRIDATTEVEQIPERTAFAARAQDLDHRALASALDAAETVADGLAINRHEAVFTEVHVRRFELEPVGE